MPFSSQAFTSSPESTAFRSFAASPASAARSTRLPRSAVGALGRFFHGNQFLTKFCLTTIRLPGLFRRNASCLSV